MIQPISFLPRPSPSFLSPVVCALQPPSVARRHPPSGPARDQHQRRRPPSPAPQLPTCATRHKIDLHRRPLGVAPPLPACTHTAARLVMFHVHVVESPQHLRHSPSPPTAAHLRLDFVRFGRRRRGKFRPLPHPMLFLLVVNVVAVDLSCCCCLCPLPRLCWCCCL